MAPLNPHDVINASVAVYASETGLLDVRKAFQALVGLNEKFDFSGLAHFQSKTGAFFLKSRSGFGVIAKGKGRHQGEVLIALRGTNGAHDWVTDGNAGVQLSRTGKVVHAGFKLATCRHE